MTKEENADAVNRKLRNLRLLIKKAQHETSTKTPSIPITLKDILVNYDFIGKQDDGLDGYIALYNCTQCHSTIGLYNLSRHYFEYHKKPGEYYMRKSI